VEQFRVYLAAPVGLATPSGRIVATDVDLAWSAPVSPHVVESYVVYETESGSVVGETSDTATTVPADGEHAWSVAAVYENGLGEGDWSESATAYVEVPKLTDVQPSVLFPGEAVHVFIGGDALYLLEGDAAFDVGAGVEIEAVDVLDVSRATMLMRVASDAAAGTRDLQISSSLGTFRFVDALEVGESGQAPSLHILQNASVVQGRTATVVVEASAPLASQPTVDLGPGVVVTSAPAVDGAVASFEIAAERGAAPGMRLLVLDDGERLWAADFEVLEYRAPPDTRCSAHPSTASWLLVSLGLMIGLRRRR
jgi:hypothetical protein